MTAARDFDMRTPRFTLGFLFLVMLVAALMAAAGRYLYEAHSAAPSFGRVRLVIFVLVVPMLLMVLMQTIWEVQRWWSRHQRR